MRKFPNVPDLPSRESRGWTKKAPEEGGLALLKRTGQIVIVDKQLSGVMFSVIFEDSKRFSVSIFDLECLE